MLHVLLHMTQPTGQVQPISDADGARAWRFNDQSINDVRGVLALGSLLLADPQLRFGSGKDAEDVLWWLGPDGLRCLDTMTADAPPSSVAFPDGGYFVFREAWDAESLWIFFDCGHIGLGEWPDEVSVATHGHSDVLTIGLAAQGETLLTDLGSYTYTGPKPWHDYFRSARAHNVVLIDGQDQSELTTRWAVRYRARPRDVRWRFSNGIDFVTGAHDGYRRLTPPVIHRRSLLLIKKDRRLILRDDFEGAGHSTMEALFHGMPSVRFEQLGGASLWRIMGRKARLSARFAVSVPGLQTPSSAPTIRGWVMTGNTDPIDGWYAEDYGTKEPAPVLHVEFQGMLPMRLYTVFDLEFHQFNGLKPLMSYRDVEGVWERALDVLGLKS